MNQTVVVVDDDLDMLEFLDLLLSSRGIDVVVCSIHTDAAELIRQVLPFLVLLDLQEPSDRRAGLRVLDQLRADDATTATPVVLMSSDHLALGRHAGRFEALRARPLLKPFDVDQVFDEMERAA